MSILVIAEHDNESLSFTTLNTVTAAQEIAAQTSSDVDILVAGENCSAIAEACCKISGITRVRVADGASQKSHLAENLATQIMQVAADYSHILAPSTTFGKNVLPRVAALLDVAQLSDVCEVISADTFIRPIYAGNVMIKVQSSDAVKIITIRTTKFAEASTEGGSVSQESVETCEDSGQSRFIGRELSVSERPELTSAKIVISGGRALKDSKNFDLLFTVADKLGAAVGASRAAVDAGYVPNDFQVGQTGKVVAPDLYIAVGISGAIQHLAGMKDSKVIVAINTDSDAPIFQLADYGLVADLFDVLPEMAAALE